MLLTVAIADTTYEDLTRIITDVIVSPFALISLRRSKTHFEWISNARKVLWIYNCTISISGQPKGCESIGSSLLIAILLLDHIHLQHMPIFSEMRANLSLVGIVRQRTNKDF